MVDTTQTKESKQLQQFRRLFNKVVEEKKIKQKKKVKKDPTLNIGGLILDETRSKMGRDFYSLFYQDWEAPKKATNFTITISEQPSPGLGSLVSIKVDYNQVFKARLQPRYDYIKAVSKQAVTKCQQVIKQQASVRKQLSGF